MKTCQSCGGRMDAEHPFAVCPKCLFGDALRASSNRAVDSLEASVAADHRAHIPIRRDFFEKYELLRCLQAGGQGEVYEAWDFDLHRSVAMKRLAAEFVDSKAAVARFLAEAQIASQLEHPGILPIHDIGVDPDRRPFFTTPVLPGTTLADVFRSFRNPVQRDWDLHQVIGLVARVCEIVAYAHHRGVIHRDLKPSNILVGQFGEVRVIDWGSAHLLPAAQVLFEQTLAGTKHPAVETDRSWAIAHALDSPLATLHAGQPLTLLFCPPEVLRNELSLLGPATDIYAVGVILYELATSRPPYSNAAGLLPSLPDLRELILTAPPQSPRLVNAAVSADLAAIVDKAMAREGSARYLSMEAVAQDLRAFLEIRPVQARRVTPLLRLQKWARRNSGYVAFASLTFALLATSSFVALRLKTQKDQARQLTSLREADLCARSGRWRDVIARLAPFTHQSVRIGSDRMASAACLLRRVPNRLTANHMCLDRDVVAVSNASRK